MSNLYAGRAYCPTCKQITDFYAEDGAKTLTCGFCGKPAPKESVKKKIRPILCAPSNVAAFIGLLNREMEDENGRGEFDEETALRHAVNKIVDWMEEGEG